MGNFKFGEDGNSLIPLIGGAQTLLGALIPAGKRPRYAIPGAASEALDSARMMAMATTRPGNEYAIDQIKRQAGSAVGNLQRTSTSASQILAGAGIINNQANQALDANENKNTQFRFNALQNLQGVLQNFAKYQDRQWMENEYKPYMDRMQTKEMLIGAGLQNLVGGAQANQANQMQQKYLDWMMGGGQTETPTNIPMKEDPIDNTWKINSGLPVKIGYRDPKYFNWIGRSQ